MNHLGLPGGSASPCWVWLDVVAPESCTHPLPGPSPNTAHLVVWGQPRALLGAPISLDPTSPLLQPR